MNFLKANTVKKCLLTLGIVVIAPLSLNTYAGTKYPCHIQLGADQKDSTCKAAFDNAGPLLSLQNCSIQAGAAKKCNGAMLNGNAIDSNTSKERIKAIIIPSNTGAPAEGTPATGSMAP